MSDYGDRPLGPVSDPRAQGMRSSRSPSFPPLPRSQSAVPPQREGAQPASENGAGSGMGRLPQTRQVRQGHPQAGTQGLSKRMTSNNQPPNPALGGMTNPTPPPRPQPRDRARSGPAGQSSGFSLRRWLAADKSPQRSRRAIPSDTGPTARNGQRSAQDDYYKGSEHSNPNFRASPQRHATVPAAPQNSPNGYTPPGVQPATSFDLSSGAQGNPASGFSQSRGNTNPYQAPRHRDFTRQNQPSQYSAQYSEQYSSAPAQPHPNRQQQFTPQPPATPQLGSKVTPLRPRGTAPASSEPLPPRRRDGRSRDDRATSRMPRRSPPLVLPRPLLYTIRMLILGVGVAAIAGTLLSILSPDRADYAQNTGAPPPSTEAPAEASDPSQSPSLVANALPLGTELGHVEETLEELVTLTPGLTQTVFMVNLDSGAYVDINGDQAMPAASTIKVPILVAFLQAVDRGTIRLNQSLTLNEEDLAAGSGDLQNQPVGSQYSALEVASLMSVNSDNTATNMIIQLLGGREILNRQFRDWGLTQTVIRNPLPDLSGTNTTSAQDLASLMARLEQGQLLELRSRDRLFAIMQRTKSRNLIPSGVGAEALVANKTGDIASMLGDVALVDLPTGTRYALAVLTTRPDNDGRARELIRRVSQEVYRELQQPIAPTGGEPPVEVPNVESEGSLVPQG